MSLPSRERGLKPVQALPLFVRCSVAPLAGAWIETFILPSILRKPIMSLPSRERGLKPDFSNVSEYGRGSLPSRERGLKQQKISTTILNAISSLPSRERGLKPLIEWCNNDNKQSLPSRERGLKLFNYASSGVNGSRSPRGSVD